MTLFRSATVVIVLSPSKVDDRRVGAGVGGI
jgi:hypothetical protein